jgi:hypothetical protein
MEVKNAKMFTKKVEDKSVPYAAIFSMDAPSGYKTLLTKKSTVQTAAGCFEGLQVESFDTIKQLIEEKTATRLFRNIKDADTVKSLWSAADRGATLKNLGCMENKLYVVLNYTKKGRNVTAKRLVAMAAFKKEDPFTPVEAAS